MSSRDDSPSLLLPGSVEFEEVLATTIPFDYQAVASQGSYGFVIRPGSAGLMEAVSLKEIEEFLQSGEYEERLEEIGELLEDEE